LSAPVLSWPVVVDRTPKLPSRLKAVGRALPKEHLANYNRRQGPEYSALRANPFSKGTDPVCRLPSSTLFYRPEAANLGDLMRFRVRLERRLTIHWGFKDQCERTEYYTKAQYFTNVSSFSPDKPIRRSGVVKEQRKRSSGLTLVAQFQLCCHKSPI
jgi:hypothetical protein